MSLPLNEGSIDRVLRVVLGIVLLALTVTGPRTAWGFMGFVPLLTGLTGFCPLYRLLGINTRPARSRTATCWSAWRKAARRTIPSRMALAWMCISMRLQRLRREAQPEAAARHALLVVGA